MTTNVILRKTPGVAPCVQFYSMPASVLGGGDTVDDATDRAVAALIDDDPSIDGIVRHVEVPAIDGFFVRMMLSDHDFDDREDRMVGVNALLDVLTSIPDGAAGNFNEAQAASGDVVLVVAQPGDTMGWVFDQMTPFDSLWLALNSGDSIEFVALHGGRAPDRDDSENAIPIDPDKVRDMPIAAVLKGYLSNEVSRAGQLTLA